MHNDESNTRTEELLTQLDDSELDMVAGGAGRICILLYGEWGDQAQE